MRPYRRCGEMPKVEFYFDFGSPNAYLAHLVIPEIEQRTGAKFEYVPILLGGVFKLTNNRSPVEAWRTSKTSSNTKTGTAALRPSSQYYAVHFQSVLSGQYAPDHARRDRGSA